MSEHKMSLSEKILTSFRCLYKCSLLKWSILAQIKYVFKSIFIQNDNFVVNNKDQFFGDEFSISTNLIKYQIEIK